MSYEKRSIPSSSQSIQDRNSSGVSRPAVQPLQKASIDDTAFSQMHDDSKAFSLSAGNRPRMFATTPFQLKRIIQLKGMEIGSEEFTSGSYKGIEKLIGGGYEFSADERLIIDQWILQEIVFENIEDFRTELALLLENWEKQKVFYEPQASVSAPQASGSTVTMYSARGVADIDALYLWADAISTIALVGFAEYIEMRNPAKVLVEAPFQGHFGDRVHTRKHWKQKSSAGATGIIAIELNEVGSSYINKMRNPVSAKKAAGPKLAGGKKGAGPKLAGRKKKAAEGKSVGEIGFKSELHFVSAAVGQTKHTWKLMAPMIRKITLLKSTVARKEEKKSDKSAEVSSATGAVAMTPEQVAREEASARILDHLGRSRPIAVDPRANPAPVDPSAVAKAQGIRKVEKTEGKKEARYKGKDYGNEANWLIQDFGAGGDCLFLSLNGSKNLEQATRTRIAIVNFQRGNRSIGQGVVDNDFAGMLQNSPHREFSSLLPNARGRENIPVAAYYELMESQGTWGGRSEVAAYSDLLGNDIYVIEVAGDISRYRDGSFAAVDSIPNSAFRDNSIVLYKTANHWRRVMGKAR